MRQDYLAGGGQDPCVAIDVPARTSPFKVAAQVMEAALEELELRDMADFVRELALVQVRQDSMGMGSIVYFPGVLAP